MVLGIDASNIGGGGGVTHLKEILLAISKSKERFGIEQIIVFSSTKTLNQITNIDNDFIQKVTFPQFNGSLFKRVVFQMFKYDLEIYKRCDLLFSIAGDYFGTFKPVVGMSRNMLLYERDIWREIKQPKEIIRFWLNFKKQKCCFKNAAGIIFISEYAKDYANKVLEISTKKQTNIPHGISSMFNGEVQNQKELSSYSVEKPFNFLYVSTVHVYKNQWHVVRAVSNLRKKGFPITLTLVGGVIFTPAGELLNRTIRELDPSGDFIFYKGHIPYKEISSEYKKASGIIFASNCENMPNILMESMASGVPIICSNKQPMPEFLKQNGYYFDPKDVESIEKSIKDFLSSPKKRELMAKNNIKEINNYSWDKTAKHTFSFLSEIYLNYKK
ncbi:glycosyltransferase family 4 protein [Oceanihabitans sediminis]|uniref:glycosyltransferase family 4 protein n=1 Tax=Oceanihabitans sediminis TaxID=1812012 RepID=UPI003A8D417E